MRFVVQCCNFQMPNVLLVLVFKFAMLKLLKITLCALTTREWLIFINVFKQIHKLKTNYEHLNHHPCPPHLLLLIRMILETKRLCQNCYFLCPSKIRSAMPYIYDALLCIKTSCFIFELFSFFTPLPLLFLKQN